MGARQKEWAARKRYDLMQLLGNKCVDCRTSRKLQFDVIHPVGNDKHHKMDSSTSITFYWRQYEANNLALRCRRCNGKKSDNLVLVNFEKPPEQPF